MKNNNKYSLILDNLSSSNAWWKEKIQIILKNVFFIFNSKGSLSLVFRVVNSSRNKLLLTYFILIIGGVIYKIR